MIGGDVEHRGGTEHRKRLSARAAEIERDRRGLIVERARPIVMLGHLRVARDDAERPRSEEHTSELQSLMRTSYAVLWLKKKTTNSKIIQQELTNRTSRTQM